MVATAEMRVAEAVTAEVAATTIATPMPAAVKSTTVAAAMTTTMAGATVATTAVSAFCQHRARQHRGQRNHGNSDNRSQHRVLPQIPTIEASEIVGIWNPPTGWKFRAAAAHAADRAATGATPPARSCRG
jgi:hypothetical protein